MKRKREDGTVIHTGNDEVHFKTGVGKHPYAGAVIRWIAPGLIRICLSKICFAHKQYGYIMYWKNRKHIRTEYAPGHPLHGHIEGWKHGVHILTRYARFHPLSGQVKYFDPTLHTRWQTHYEHGHRMHGVIEFWDAGALVKIVYSAGHVCHGEIHHWHNGRHVRTEYEWYDKRHGLIDFFYGQTMRRQYAVWHADHGRVDYYQGGIRRYTTFDPWKQSRKRANPQSVKRSLL
jgi:hypothetical protein